MASSASIKKTFTEKELAERLSVSTKTLQAWRQQGKPPAFMKINRSVRYSIADIEKFERDVVATSTVKA